MKNLQFLRKNLKKTQAEVAQDLKLQKQTYQNYELGKRQPDSNTLILLADYFGVSIDYLLEHETKNIIHADGFNGVQQNIISLIKILDDDLCNKAEAYIEGLAATQQERDNVRKKFS